MMPPPRCLEAGGMAQMTLHGSFQPPNLDPGQLPLGILQCKLGWIYREGQPLREFLHPECRLGVSEVRVHVRSCVHLWLPDFWHPKQELDCSAISSLLADYQSLVSSRAGIRKTAFPRTISLSETLTIGPPSRKMCRERDFKESAGEVLEQEHNSLSSVI